MAESPEQSTKPPADGLRRAAGHAVRRIRRGSRKHRLAVVLLATVILILFLPTITSLRLLSPNDVYYHYDPWMSLATVRAQNQLIHDPPLSYFTLVSLVRDRESFHWNRYVGGGIPGTGSAASAVLSPFVLLPALLLPLQWSYSGIVLLKLGVAFCFSYLWMREERLGKRAAAVGASARAAAGPVAIWWLWQGTNATALYPALLWAIARLARGKHNNLLALVLLGVCFLLSGYPATIAYGFYFGAAYLAVSLVRFRALPRREIVKCVQAGVASLAIAAPMLDPFFGFLSRTGYLESRADASARIFFPLSHLRSFLQPFWLGDPVARSWIGDSALGPLNNFVEVTVYLGLVTLALAMIGIFRPGLRMRWFFLAAAIVLLALMFHPPAGRLVAGIPGLKFSPLVRLRVLLPVPVAFLAAAGFAVLDRRLRGIGLGARFPIAPRVAGAIALAVAADLAIFAAWFHPHIPLDVAELPKSKTIDYLRAQPGPFRIAPTFFYLMPNSAQLARLEDIRAHWGAERAYRDLLGRIDPESIDRSTVITFNSLRMDLDDPVLSLLNARFILEPPSIDILRYLIQERTEWVVRPAAPLALRSGGSLDRTFTIEKDGVWAIAIPFDFVSSAGGRPGLDVKLVAIDDGEVIFESRYTAAELARMPVLHLPLRPAAASSRAFTLSLKANGVWLNLLAGSENAGPEELAWGMVTRPLVLERSFKDGRIFRNLAALPRFWATWDVVELDRDAFMTDDSLDFRSRTVITGPVPFELRDLDLVPVDRRRVAIELRDRADGGYDLVTRSSAPFLLNSSEKLTPELRVLVDGKSQRAFSINSIFAGVLVPSGEHRVAFERRIGRGWWPLSGCALLLVGLAAWRDRELRARAAAR